VAEVLMLPLMASTTPKGTLGHYIVERSHSRSRSFDWIRIEIDADDICGVDSAQAGSNVLSAILKP
ncbi:MAG TPA: hypothetical protein VFN20_05120, partial [Candidatus Acidoferrum sp.]|nr:hypothetical protein [Candidatus Acidoferrum sp.]